jgi:hypothetical protein
MLFPIGAAALQAAIDWVKIRRITGLAYELVEAMATSKIVSNAFCCAKSHRSLPSFHRRRSCRPSINALRRLEELD